MTALPATHGRYICKDCKTYFEASMTPVIVNKTGHILTPQRAQYFVDTVHNYFDDYFLGNQGITTGNFLKGLVEFIVWRRVRHKSHRVDALSRLQPLPGGYTKEPPITNDERSVYLSERARKKIESPGA